MNGRRSGLGRGLDALIPTQLTQQPPADPAPNLSSQEHPPVHEDAASAVAGLQVLEVPVTSVDPNPRQPRSEFDEEELTSLAASIAEVGVLQPVVVRPPVDGRYELVMGERRLRASKLAGRTTIPIVVRPTDDRDLLRDALVENLHRSDLNPLEEAAAYQALLQDLGATHEQLAERLGVSRAAVTNTIRLLQLPPTVQRRVAAKVLSAGHARALLSLPDPVLMEEIAARIVAEGLSVRATEELVALARRAPRRRPSRSGGSGVQSFDEVADRLADRLDTRVRVEMGRRKGRIVVEFASVDDLERIVDVLSPGTGHSASAPGESVTAEEPIYRVGST